MRRRLFLAMLAAVSAAGHHGYAEYDRGEAVSLEGTITHVVWGNPHVLMTLQTENKGEYSIEWAAVFQLSRQGITSCPINQGDHVVIIGSINKNPEKRIITLLREIKRPADGWHWADPRYTTGK